jgi:hypothetical protein
MSVVQTVDQRRIGETIEDARLLIKFLQFASDHDGPETVEALRDAVKEMYTAVRENNLPLTLLIPPIENPPITEEDARAYIDDLVEERTTQLQIDKVLSELQPFCETPNKCLTREWDIEEIAAKVKGLGDDDQRGGVERAASRAHVAMAKVHYDHLLRESGAKPVYHHYRQIQTHLGLAGEDFKAIANLNDDRSSDAIQSEIQEWAIDCTIDYTRGLVRRLQQFNLPQSLTKNSVTQHSKISDLVDPLEIYSCLHEVRADVKILGGNAETIIQNGCRRQMVFILEEIRSFFKEINEKDIINQSGEKRPTADLEKLYLKTIKYAGLSWEEQLKAKSELNEVLNKFPDQAEHKGQKTGIIHQMPTRGDWSQRLGIRPIGAKLAR